MVLFFLNVVQIQTQTLQNRCKFLIVSQKDEFEEGSEEKLVVGVLFNFLKKFLKGKLVIIGRQLIRFDNNDLKLRKGEKFHCIFLHNQIS